MYLLCVIERPLDHNGLSLDEWLHSLYNYGTHNTLWDGIAAQENMLLSTYSNRTSLHIALKYKKKMGLSCAKLSSGLG